MAKKTTKKRPAAKTTTKAPRAKAKRQAPAKKAGHVEIELDAIEIKAIKLAHSSAKVQRELEEAVSLATCQAVRKVLKGHKISLAPPQTQKVAAILFGD
jgi:hypothetical protein